MSPKRKDKKLIKEGSLTCKPLDSYSEIVLFLENPPPWRSLCKGMTPHSNNLIRNIEINKDNILDFDQSPAFCHFNPDADEPNRYDVKALRKTLVCHDMANGYHYDSVVDGTGDYDGYTFYNWAGIDIFCYFSHHLITIPPVGWINIAHAHGVKVIGTVITEWAEGINFWDQVLVSETEYRNLASALVAIAKTLKFDGWLLNIENKVLKPETLLEFVRYFHKLLHEELEHAVLIWYDSVTIQGTLNWQNGLNAKNKVFFHACDGFFTNYSWTVDDVLSSAAEAEERVTDLYIGIDVWGRNFYGGGQFNTQEAIRVANHAGCSLAIFAPAWTHEALSNEKGDPNSVALADDIEPYAKFLLRDRAFWDSIWFFLNTRVPMQIPFQTSFCRGQGKKRRLYGEVLSPMPWYNLRHQQYQPNAAHGAHTYVLTSTAKKVVHTPNNDRKGIIKYRSTRISAEIPHDRKDSTVSVDSVQEEIIYGGKLPAQSSVETIGSKKVGTKMKNAIKCMFKQKVKSAEDDRRNSVQQVSKSESKIEGKIVESDNALDEEVTEASCSKEMSSSGRSMMQMSLNLNLGTSAEKVRYSLVRVPEGRDCLETFYDDSFIGGACLRVNPSDKLTCDHRYTRLFFCDFQCENTLVFCVVTKLQMQYRDQTLNVILVMKNANNEDLTLILTGRDVSSAAQLDRSSVGVHFVYPLNTASEEVFKELRTYLLIHQPGFYVPVENIYGWTVRYYQVTVPGSRITSINLRTGMPAGGILLGHFGLCSRNLQST